MMRTCLALGLCLGLLACGGGGGSAESSPPATQPPSQPAPSVTGFVPAAGVPGASLVAQAVQIRPVRAGLRSHFRRVDFQPTGALSRQDIWVRQSRSPDGRVLEARRGDVIEDQTLEIDATGQVLIRTELSLQGTSQALRLDGVELVSPLRANQQIVTLDRRIVGSTVDADRDGRGDTLDIALWRTVVGFENVELPRVAAPVRAVRVDSEAQIRITPSSGSAPIQSRQRLRTWYAEGVGVVKEQEFDEASQMVAEEVLLGFDGGDVGLGALIANDPFHSQNPLPLPTSSTELLGEVSPQRGFDRFGKLFETPLRAALGAGATRTFLLADGAVDVANSDRILRIRRLDRQLAVTGDTVLDLAAYSEPDEQFWNSSIQRVVAHPGAAVAWVVWERSPWTGDPRRWWMARAFNATGFVGPERAIAQSDLAQNLSARPQANALALSWTESTPEARNRLRLALLSTDRDPVLAQWSDEVPNLNAFFEASVIGGGGNQWLTWTRQLGDRNAKFAMRLDSQLQAVGMPAGWDALQAAALLPALSVDAGNALLDQQLWASDESWWQVLRIWGRAFPMDMPSHFLEVRLMDPGTPVPANGLRELRRIRLEFGEALAAAPIAFERHWLLLVLTEQRRAIVPVLVWR